MMDRLFKAASLAGRPKPNVAFSPADAIHRENKLQVLRYRPRAEGVAFRTPVLLVPSLINRHYVMDLLPGRSLVEFLVGRGHDVYVIDWGTPGAEDRYLTFDHICDRYLGRAVRAVARHAGVEKVHLMGYCLGGTLAVIHAAVRPEHVATLTAVAAPVRFDDGGLLASWTRLGTFNVDALVDAFGNVPWQIMQAAFHLLRPTLTAWKAVRLLDNVENDAFVDSFIAMETWGNDNVSFPGECYRRYVRELYRDDALINGTFHLGGRDVRLENIHCPTLAVTFEHDNIVPWEGAAVLLERIASPDRHRLHLPGGHVGAMVARSAAQGLWRELSEWWGRHEADHEGRAKVAPAPRRDRSRAHLS